MAACRTDDKYLGPRSLVATSPGSKETRTHARDVMCRTASSKICPLYTGLFPLVAGLGGIIAFTKARVESTRRIILTPPGIIWSERGYHWSGHIGAFGSGGRTRWKLWLCTTVQLGIRALASVRYRCGAPSLCSYPRHGDSLTDGGEYFKLLNARDAVTFCDSSMPPPFFRA